MSSGDWGLLAVTALELGPLRGLLWPVGLENGMILSCCGRGRLLLYCVYQQGAQLSFQNYAWPPRKTGN